MDWLVASPYFENADVQWISDKVEKSKHSFQLVPRYGEDRNWHQSKSRAGLAEWRNRLKQANKTINDYSGIITVFPQLAAAVSVLKTFKRSKQPLVAWFFNTESLSGPRRHIGKQSLRKVDKFAVHSTVEIKGYSELLGMPAEKFEFVPLQYGGNVETAKPAGQDEPYIFATGSGYRDYKTFFAAVESLGYKTLVLASDRVLNGLEVPKNVTILEQISRPEIRKLVRHAAVNVVPMNDTALTAGLITIVETFRHARSLVITDRPGLDDYIFDNTNALTAKLFDPNSMAEKIEAIWNDKALSDRLDASAYEFAEQNCTDAAAAKSLVRILDQF